MHIPPRFQSFLDDDLITVQKLRKGTGRIGAYRSSNPEIRRSVRLNGRTEVDKLKKTAKSLKVTVRTDESLNELKSLAYEHYRDRNKELGHTVARKDIMSPGNLNRITVNVIRHSRTEYDRSLGQTRALQGPRQALVSRVIKIKCLEEIALKFPELAAECERQALTIKNSLERAAQRSDMGHLVDTDDMAKAA